MKSNKGRVHPLDSMVAMSREELLVASKALWRSIQISIDALQTMKEEFQEGLEELLDDVGEDEDLKNSIRQFDDLCDKLRSAIEDQDDIMDWIHKSIDLDNMKN